MDDKMSPKGHGQGPGADVLNFNPPFRKSGVVLCAKKF